MNAAEPLVDDCIASLLASFPIEDIWLLDPGTAKECLLEEKLSFVVIVPDAPEIWKIERKARELIRKEFPDADIGIHIFPQSAMFQTPRPLLVKMAFTGGKNVYRG